MRQGQVRTLSWEWVREVRLRVLGWQRHMRIWVGEAMSYHLMWFLYLRMWQSTESVSYTHLVYDAHHIGYCIVLIVGVFDCCFRSRKHLQYLSDFYIWIGYIVAITKLCLISNSCHIFSILSYIQVWFNIWHKSTNATDYLPVSYTHLDVYKRQVPVTENGTLTYTFRIQNYGSVAATNTTGGVITDTFAPVLNNLTAALNGTAWTAATDYTCLLYTSICV